MIDLDIFGRGRIRELEYDKRELMRKISERRARRREDRPAG